MPQSTHWSACTAQRHNGSFCDSTSIPDAPFPICTKHAAQLYAFLRTAVDEASQDKDRSLDIFLDLFAKRQEVAVREEQRYATDGVVYYVQIGSHIKIGCTINLKQRLAGYPPNRRLLATEPGYELEEAHRLTQFAEYRDMGREWFRPGPGLIEHINRLRRQQGARPVVAAA